MNYGKVLPFTGGTGLILGGLFISEYALLLGAVVVVLGAAIAIRYAWRRNLKINDVE